MPLMSSSTGTPAQRRRSVRRLRRGRCPPTCVRVLKATAELGYVRGGRHTARSHLCSPHSLSSIGSVETISSGNDGIGMIVVQ
jgi:hypothetical protein